MAFYYSKRKTRVRDHEDGVGELNIVPYLDIMMNLIMFMLLSMTGLAAFGILNVSAPNYGGAAAGPGDHPEQPKLLLSVLISNRGFYVAGAGAVLGQDAPNGGAAAATDSAPTVPKKGDAYDYSALTAKMLQVKEAFPSETKVIVGAEADVTYETLIQTMDSIREANVNGEHKLLFSDVTLAAM